MMNKKEQEIYERYKDNATHYECLWKEQNNKIVKLLNYLDLKIPQVQILEHQQELKYIRSYLEK